MKNVLSFLIAVICATSLTVRTQAQSWIPEDLTTSIVLIERFKYQDPNMTLSDIDEMYEDQRDEFIENTNENLERFNVRLDSIFRTCKIKVAPTDLGKMDEQFSNIAAYRYVLRRDVFFGKKKVLNSAQKPEDQSYIAYRYYFYDRVLKKTYPYYYFSGTQWAQLQRIVFWLNQYKPKQ